jgi:hypothetical protein
MMSLAVCISAGAAGMFSPQPAQIAEIGFICSSYSIVNSVLITPTPISSPRYDRLGEMVSNVHKRWSILV